MTLVSISGEAERAMVRRVLEGDAAAFSRLMDMHTPWMMRVALRMLRDEAEAEEVVQEAFLKVWRSMRSWQPSARLSTWMYRILVNTTIDRTRKPQIQVIGEEYDDGQTIGDDGQRQLEANDLKQRVWQAIDDLPVRQKAAFILFQYEGHSLKEVAEMMDSSEKAIESLLVRAKKGLQVALLSKAADYVPEAAKMPTAVKGKG